MLFDFTKLSTNNRYKILSYTIVPRPIAWVVTVGANGDRNAAPFSFFNVLTSKPPILGIGVTTHGQNVKDTARHINETKQFVVNLVPAKLINEMNLTAVEFEPGVDELDVAGLSVLPSSMVKPPRIAESPVAFECELYHDHAMESGQHIILGRVLAAHVADEAVINAEKCYIDTLKLGLVGRMDNRYLNTDQAFALPRISLEDWKAGRRS
jgi:flavin reductase (DIM6/NTAB) family NADH-FMN oxidoreductase RutF